MVKKYRSTVTKLAVLMIMQFCLWSASSFVYVVVCENILSQYSSALSESLGELLFSFLYAVSFGAPILLGRKIIKKGERTSFSRTVPKNAVPMICASIGIIFAFAILSAILTRPFDSLGFDIYTPDTSMTLTPITFFAHFLSLVIVPSFFEEMLFRGVMLGTLLPYGRAGAIVISALLFAMMHQNPKQFIYAATAGAVIGYFVSETGSITIGVLIHATNNFISLVNMSVINSCSEKVIQAYSGALCFAIFALTLLAVPVLINKKKNSSAGAKKDQVLPFLKHLFTPAMIIYFVISAAYFVYMVAI